MDSIKDNKTLWKKGDRSPNPNGRPKGTGKPISGLRSTLGKLRELEAKCIENISAVVNGMHKGDKEKDISEVDKQMLETSKWVISTISSMSRAASGEEELRWNIRRQAEEAEKEEKKEGTNDAPANVIKGRFTTKLVDDVDEE